MSFFASLWSMLGKEQHLPERTGRPEPGSDALAEPQQGAEHPKMSQQRGRGAPHTPPLPGSWEGAQPWSHRSSHRAHCRDGGKSQFWGASTPTNTQSCPHTAKRSSGTQSLAPPAPTGAASPAPRRDPLQPPTGVSPIAPTPRDAPTLKSGVRERGTPPAVHPDPRSCISIPVPADPAAHPETPPLWLRRCGSGDP